MGKRRFDLRAIWREARRVVEEVARAGSDDNVPMMAAAISYYLLVTIAPLALIVSIVAGTVTQTAATTGTAGPEALRQSLAAVSREGSTAVVLVTLAIVLFGAAGVFSQFVLAVTRIWKEPPVRGPIYSFARRHGLGLPAARRSGRRASGVGCGRRSSLDGCQRDHGACHRAWSRAAAPRRDRQRPRHRRLPRVVPALPGRLHHDSGAQAAHPRRGARGGDDGARVLAGSDRARPLSGELEPGGAAGRRGQHHRAPVVGLLLLDDRPLRRRTHSRLGPLGEERAGTLTRPRGLSYNVRSRNRQLGADACLFGAHIAGADMSSHSG